MSTRASAAATKSGNEVTQSEATVRGDHRAAALHALVSRALTNRNGIVTMSEIATLLNQAGLHRQSWRNEIEALGFWIEWSDSSRFDVRSQPPRCVTDLVRHVVGTIQSRPYLGEPGFAHVADIATKHCREVILPAIRVALRTTGRDALLFDHLAEIDLLRLKSKGKLIGLGKLGSEMSGLSFSSAVSDAATNASANADPVVTRVLSSKALVSSTPRPPASTTPAASEAGVPSPSTASAAAAASAAVSPQRDADVGKLAKVGVENSDRKSSALNAASVASDDFHGLLQMAHHSQRQSSFTVSPSNRCSAFDLKVSSGTFGETDHSTPFPIEDAADDGDSAASASASAASSISQSILGKRAQNEILATSSGVFKIVRNASDIDSTGMEIPTDSDETKIRRVASTERNVWDSLLEADDESDQLCRGWGGARSSQSASDVCVSVASLSAPLIAHSDSSGT